MMWEKKAVALLSLVMIWTFAGCETDSGEKIAKLQEQVARVTQQLNDTKKQVDGLQEANQRSVQAIENLSATIARLSAAPPAAPPSGKSPAKGFVEQDIPPSAKSGRIPPESLPTPASAPPSSFSDEPDSAAESQQRTTPSPAISCANVCKQLGQGKSAEAVARMLGTSVDTIHACEQKIGRHGAGR